MIGAGQDAPRLEVWRGRRRILEGTLDDLTWAAREGLLRHSDRVGPEGSADRVSPRRIPALARLVPDREEYLLRRSLRALLVFDWIVGPLVLLATAILVAAVLLGSGPGPEDRHIVGFALGVAFLFALLFVAPIRPLRRRLRALQEARERGEAPPSEIRTSGDPRLDALLRRRPVVTWTVTAAIVAISLAAFALPDEALARRLAKVNERILAGEWWRLLTVALVHGSPMHLFFNAYALLTLGALVERLYGRARLGVVLAAGTAAATAASLVWTRAPAVGASGGIFALVGALLVLGLRRRSALPDPVRRRLLRDMAWITALNLALGFTVAYVDNAAHLGGLAAGAALGALLGPDPEARLSAPGPSGGGGNP